MKFNIKKSLIYVVFATILIAFDQFTKYLAVIKLKGNDGFEVIKNVLKFEYVENRGAAWGMLGGQRVLFIILTLIIIPLMILFVYRIEKVIFECNEKKTINKFNILQFIIITLVAGAIGNFIDRLVNQYVVDFLYFKLIDFPVFNVADCYVTIATFLLIVLMIFGLSSDEFDVIFPSKKKTVVNNEKDVER